MTTKKLTLMDRLGRLVNRKDLTQEQAPPTVSGVRKPFFDAISRGLTPSKLASILDSASTGDNIAYLTLAEEMEERDTHYASVLSQRKLAVSLIQPVVDGEGVPDAISEAVESLVTDDAFQNLVDDLLDGIGKGYACVEPMWPEDGELWQPYDYVYRDPRHFMFDKKTGRELRIREEGNDEGREIPPYAMVIHRPKLKSGLTTRAGLARLCAWAFMLKTYTLQDWAAFLEVFGMPLRVGKFHRNASDDERRVLLRAVRDLGSDAAAIIPSEMEIEFIEAKGGQGNAVFGAMADYLDKQVSKAVIGQTMTTDDGSSLAQAEVHGDVKLQIQKADARQLAATIQRDLIEPFVKLNFGDTAEIPKIKFPVADPENIETFSNAVSRLVEAGLKVSQEQVRDRIGLTAPDDADELLVPPGATQNEPANEPETKAGQKPKRQKDDETETASSQLAAEHIDDERVEEALGEWECDMGPLVEQVMAAAQQADGFEDFLKSLDDMDPDVSELAKTLAIQAMKSRGDGDLGE